jgi:hypothetical protein
MIRRFRPSSGVMKPKFGNVIEILSKEVPWEPNKADAAAASAALALTIALLRALRDRGVLSQGEIDDLLSEASGRLSRTQSSGLVERVRASLELKETDE